MVNHQCGDDGKGSNAKGEQRMLTSTDSKGSHGTCAQSRGDDRA